jgi:hypothetical protein
LHHHETVDQKWDILALKEDLPRLRVFLCFLRHADIKEQPENKGEDEERNRKTEMMNGKLKDTRALFIPERFFLFSPPMES